jgi:hypothetical protein
MGPRGKPADIAVTKLHATLKNELCSDMTDGQIRHVAQLILYVDDACRAVVASIEGLGASQYDQVGPALADVKNEFQFLKTIFNDKEFLKSMDFVNRPGYERRR